MITFELLTEVLDKMDERCLEDIGQSLGAGIIGTKHTFAVSLEQVLWCDDDNPVNTESDLREHIIDGLEGLRDRINLSLAALRDMQNTPADTT